MLQTRRKSIPSKSRDIFGNIVILTQDFTILIQKLGKKGYLYELLVDAYGEKQNMKCKEKKSPRHNSRDVAATFE